jgi:DNA-binding SARP family transcriptional activator/tetratricopeptide (TPR) repeat protein
MSIVEFRVLGPLDVTVAGGSVRVSRKHERELLALLLLNAGRWVAVDRIVAVLWADEPPRGALKTLTVYVSRLRQTLSAAGAPQLLERRGDSYRVAVPPLTVDCHRFDALVREAAALPDPIGRAAKFDEALRLWNGPMFADAPALRALGETWEQRRREALRQRLSADVDAGRAPDVIGELAEAAEAEPFDEELAILLMRTLASLGRRNDALDAFTRLRRHLRDELGLDPGPAVARLQEQILRGESGTPPTAARPAVARQLPPQPTFFAGRHDDLAVLEDLMKRADGSRVICIAGVAGVGKTTLAVHLAYRVRDAYPDGQLYLDLRGFSPAGALDTDDALRTLLLGLGVTPQLIPVDREARLGLYRSLLSRRRVLVVLDNAGSADQVRPLLPPGEESAALVTSRSRLNGLVVTHGSQPVELALLDERDARDILIARLGRHRVDAEPVAVAAILARCAGLPLALAVVGAYAVTRERLSLADIVSQLGRSLSVAADADPATDLHSVFSWSYKHLSEPAALVFRRMGVIPDGQLSPPAAAALAMIRPEHTRAVLSELVNAGLVTEIAPDRFSAHDLLSAYAAELAEVHDRPEDLDAARLRLYEYYHATAWQARLLLYPDPTTDIETIPAAGIEFHNEDEARNWYGAERTNFVRAVTDAADRGWNDLALGLLRAVVFYLDRTGHPQDCVQILERCLPVAAGHGTEDHSAFIHRCLGFLYIAVDRESDAEAHLHRSIELHQRIGDERGLANTMIGFGHLHNRRGDYAALRTTAQAAYEIYQKAGATDWAAGALNTIAWAHVNLGELETAMDRCRQALQLLESAGASDTTHAAGAWDTYGVALHRSGQCRAARDVFLRAIEIFRRRSPATRLAIVLDHLGDCESGLGDELAARSAYQEALDLVTAIEPKLAGQLRAKLQQQAVGMDVYVRQASSD